MPKGSAFERFAYGFFKTTNENLEAKREKEAKRQERREKYADDYQDFTKRTDYKSSKEFELLQEEARLKKEQKEAEMAFQESLIGSVGTPVDAPNAVSTYEDLEMKATAAGNKTAADTYKLAKEKALRTRDRQETVPKGALGEAPGDALGRILEASDKGTRPSPFTGKVVDSMTADEHNRGRTLAANIQSQITQQRRQDGSPVTSSTSSQNAQDAIDIASKLIQYDKASTDDERLSIMAELQKTVSTAGITLDELPSIDSLPPISQTLEQVSRPDNTDQKNTYLSSPYVQRIKQAVQEGAIPREEAKKHISAGYDVFQSTGNLPEPF